MNSRRILLPLALTAVAALAYQGSYMVFAPASDAVTRAIAVKNTDSISGGGNSTPSSSSQKYASPSCSISTGTRITITDASGNVIMSAPNLSNVSSPKLFVSSPKMTAGTYKVMSGGTISGGVASNDMTVGGTLSGGSQNTTFTAR